MASLDRRTVLRAAGLGLLSFSVQGAEVLLTPKDARERNLALKVLSASEVATLESFGEILLPGARNAGIAHFVDHQLAAPPADSLLMLRYLDVPPPYIQFYRPALTAFEAVARAKYKQAPADLSGDEGKSLVSEMSRGNPEGWQGPPAPLVYFVLRNDAVDVVYGTPQGFEALGVPYMAHILPPSGW